MESNTVQVVQLSEKEKELFDLLTKWELQDVFFILKGKN